MPKPKTQAANGHRVDDVEAAFYEALQTADIDKLMACWADEDDIVCVHPGGPRVVGPGAIRAAFDGHVCQWPDTALAQSVRKVDSLASAVHNVLERIVLMTARWPA
jgi:ketosteroid isomerase-like protein